MKSKRWGQSVYCSSAAGTLGRLTVWEHKLADFAISTCAKNADVHSNRSWFLRKGAHSIELSIKNNYRESMITPCNCNISEWVCVLTWFGWWPRNTFWEHFYNFRIQHYILLLLLCHLDMSIQKKKERATIIIVVNWVCKIIKIWNILDDVILCLIF